MEEKEILDTSVVLTRKEGLVTALTVVEHPVCFRKEFEILFPEDKDYMTAIAIAGKLRAQGTPVGAVDILIASIGLNRSLTVVTKDKDFKTIKTVAPELKVRLV